MSTTPASTTSISTLLNRIFDGETLSEQEASSVMGQLMDGNLEQMQASALLAALRTRGETIEEIVGFAKAMRARAITIDPPVGVPLLDVVGTGGTGINTFNISTATIFVVAASGITIAKHGNRGITRQSGSADVLEHLGVNLNLTPEQCSQALKEIGLVFLYARSHHPAMRFVAPIRSSLQARTIFNSLGPLTNPAEADYQLMGVYHPSLTDKLARVLAGLGVKRGMVVHGSGLDELSVCGVNTISEFEGDAVRNYGLHPEEVGLTLYPQQDLLGSMPEENAKTIRKVISGQLRGAKRDIVRLNAGAALYIMGKADTVEKGISQATELMDTGAALEKLEQLITFTTTV